MDRWVLLLLLAVGGRKAEVYVQGFNWATITANTSRRHVYETLAQQAPMLARASIAGVWLPPPTLAADNAGYMPGEWYRLRDEASLQDLIQTLHSLNMMAIVDLVLNHRTGGSA